MQSTSSHNDQHQARSELRWGRWIYRASNYTLEDATTGYYVDLETCASSAQVLDWIAQIGKKTWCSDEDLGHLARALDDLLDLQAKYCSFGQNRPKKSRSQIRDLLRQQEPRIRAARRWDAEMEAKGTIWYSADEWRRYDEIEREEGVR